jgi:TonB family protein
MRLKSIIFLLVFINNYAQTSTEKNEVFPIFPICELLPESKLADCFSETMQEHIDDNFFYPKQAWDLDLQAIVRVRFDINENGDVSNVTPKASVVGVSFKQREALNAARQLFQISALEIINSLPKFDGVPINKTFQISIKYEIPREASFDEVTVAPLIEGCEELEGDESRDCFENGVTKHISENFKYPRKALKNQIEGDVFIQFSIDKFGFLIDFTTVGPDKVLEDEAYRIMSSLKVKKPAQLNGKNVKMTYGIPISFRLN